MKSCSGVQALEEDSFGEEDLVAFSLPSLTTLVPRSFDYHCSSVWKDKNVVGFGVDNVVDTTTGALEPESNALVTTVIGEDNRANSTSCIFYSFTR